MPRTDEDLIEQYTATHDPAIREELILKNAQMVHFVLGRLGISRSNNDDYDDLESQGLLGVIEAVDHYKPEYGARLSTYASLKIRSKVLDYLRNMDWLPRTARRRVKLIQEGMLELETKMHRTPTDEELALHLQMDVEVLQQAMVDSSHQVVSLDEDNEDATDGNLSLQERLSDENQPNPSESFEVEEQQKRLVSILKALPEREQMVLSLYYFEELTFKEIGKVLDISESRVCQIHGRAVMDLKVKLDGSKKSSESRQMETRP